LVLLILGCQSKNPQNVAYIWVLLIETVAYIWGGGLLSPGNVPLRQGLPPGQILFQGDTNNGITPSPYTLAPLTLIFNPNS